MSEMVRDNNLERKARSLYSDNLPYHNFSHIQETLKSAAIILKRCQREGIQVKAQIVYAALLFHDAGYHEDHLRRGYQNKELYAVALSRPVLKSHGFSPSSIEEIGAAIMATERNAQFLCTEHKAVRAADLSSMAATYDQFLKSSLKLKFEYEMLNQKRISWSSWKSVSRDVLGFHLSREIKLTTYFYDKNGESAFHNAVRNNLERLMKELTPPELIRL